MQKKYFIVDGYKHRTHEVYFDDTGNKDEYQDEVYKTALNIFVENNLNSIVDYGCGSGYKLIKYFDKYKTLGFDLENTVKFLRSKYPNKSWGIDLQETIDYDMCICSDIIEHLADPDVLLDVIENSNYKFIVISTPDRDSLNYNYLGPPRNPTHIREWNVPEFNSYISSRFDILQHLNIKGTQIVICKTRRLKINE